MQLLFENLCYIEANKEETLKNIFYISIKRFAGVNLFLKTTNNTVF